MESIGWLTGFEIGKMRLSYISLAAVIMRLDVCGNYNWDELISTKSKDVIVKALWPL